ncbi:T9SS type A sorting domain-containing protein [bacterium]|nr:MAG: T9SS type A sorting domain-containing protein [bacterium]
MSRYFTYSFYFNLRLFVLCAILFLPISIFAATVTSVTLSTNYTNHYTQYTIVFATGNGSTDIVASESDYFIVTFPSDTYVPTNISTTNVTINGQAATSVSVSGRQVTIVTPTDIPKNGGTATIIFSSAAKIRNPKTAGSSYTINVDSYDGTPALKESATSTTYSILASNTTVTAAAVTPSTSVELVQSQYQVAFSVGLGGYLDNTSTVTLTLPSNTTVPNGAISGVTVNNSTATATGNSSTREVVIYSPVDVDNEGAVSILISSGAGIKNPTAGESYIAQIKTSSETTNIDSDIYRIAPATQLSFSSIIASDDEVNATSGYTIRFNMSTVGALTAASGDKISIGFDSEYTLPGTISTSNVSVENLISGFSGNPTSVTVAGDSITFPTPINVANSDEIKVTISSNASIVNPSISANYTFTAATFTSANAVIDGRQPSNPILITTASSTVSQASVSISPDPQPSVGSRTYTITGNVGTNGALKAGTSTFEITDFPTTITASAATVNGTTASISINGTEASITVPGTVTIANSGAFTIVLSNMTNPVAGTYTFKLATSVEPTVVNTQSFTITATTPITVGTVSLGNAGVNQQNVQYTIPITAISNLSNNNNDWIKIIFPEGTTVPNGTLNAANILIYENVGLTTSANPTSATANSSTRTVTLYVAGNNKQRFGVQFATGIGLTNPVVPSASYYKITANTSQQPTPIQSAAYTISGNATSPTAGLTTATPSTVNSSASYTVKFTPGTNGKLAGGTSAGSSTIDIFFDSSTIVPGSMSASDVTVNGVTASAVNILGSGAGGSVRVTLASNQTLSASSEATVFFKTAAGLVNGATDGTFTIQVSSSSETTNSVGTNNFTLTIDADLTVNSVSITPSNANTASGYNINFTPGDALSIGDSLIISFPANTYVPPTQAKENFLVDGSAPTSNPIVSSNQIKILSPKALSAGVAYNLQISSSAGLLNPTLVGSNYTLHMRTNIETTEIESPQYTVASAGSSVGIATVALSAQTPSSTNVNYSINFNTGTAGRLLSGTSTISVDFPTGTNYGTLSATVDGLAATVGTRVNNLVPITVPVSATVNNSDNVLVVISGITNPTTEASYTLKVNTSVETTPISSTSYSITNNGSVTINSFALSDTVVNGAADYTLNFVSGQNMTANTDYFVIGVPDGGTLPSSISTASVTVNVNNAGTTNAFDVQTNLIQRTISVYTPSAVTAGNTVEIVFLNTSGITNPKEPGSYYWTAKSNVQLVNDTTATFQIGASTLTYLSGLAVAVDPITNASPVNWTWSFSTGSRGALQAGTGKIFLNFDQSQFNNIPIPSNTIRVLGSITNNFVKNGNTLEITIPADVTIGNDFPVEVTVSSAAGIQVDPNLESQAAPTIMKGLAGSNQPPISTGLNDYSASTSAETTTQTNTSNPLPVELAFFEVVLNESEMKPQLNWATFTETENLGFTLYRKYASVDETSDWEEIRFVEGAGFSQEKLDYSFVDKDVSIAGNYLYRLIQTDFDGTKTQVGEIEFLFEKPSRLSLSPNYPNPFNPSTTIQYEIPNKQLVRIQVFDILGRVVQTLVNQNQLAGRYSVTFNAPHLASGIYFIRLQSGGLSKSIKVTLIK